MQDRIYNVLFVCTGNSARSILAEVIMNQLGGGRFSAYSAGSHPRGEVHPMAVEVLDSLKYPTAGLRSKSWDEFAGPDAVPMDFIFTVCDQAAGEACPAWPGQAVTAHWGMADPAAVEGDKAAQRRAFTQTEQLLTNRIRLFMSLPFEKFDRMSLQAAVRKIAQTQAAEAATGEVQ